MRRWKKTALLASVIAVGSVLLLAGFVAFVLPGIVKSQAVQRVEAATGRKLAIGGISLNPFTFAVEVRDFRFSERGGGETFAAFRRARVILSPLSLCRRAPIVAAARITAPHLRIVRIGANTYNFSDLLRRLPRHPRLSLNNLAVTKGSIDFVDQGLAVEKRHELRKVELAVPFVTTIPYLADRYITPRISAVVNGSPVQLEGKLRPFPKAVEASLAADLKDLVLPLYLAYVPGELPVRVESGRLSARVTVTYRAALKEDPELALDGSLSLAGLKLVDRTGAPFLAATRVEAGITGARLLAGKFDLSSVSADGLEVFLSRDEEGAWSHSRLGGGASPGAAPRRKALVRVTETRLRNARFHLVDSLPPGGFAADLQGIELDVHGYSTSPGERASYSLSFATARGEKGSAKGEFSPVPLAGTSSIELTGAALETYHPYLASVLRTRLEGRLDVEAQLNFGGPEGVRLEKASVRARKVSASFAKGEGMTLGALSLDGGRFSQKKNLLEVDEVTLKDGDLRFSRDPKGTFSPLPLFRHGREEGPKRQDAANPPFRYRIGRVSGAGMNVAFTDGMREQRPSFSLERLAFTLGKLSGPTFGPIPFRVTGSYGTEGSLRASGSLTPAPLKLNGELAIRRIPLADFKAYLPENLKMTVVSGTVDGGLDVSLAARGDRLTGTFGGSAGVGSLHCLDAEGEDLVKWETLHLDNVKGSVAPFGLDIQGMALSRFYARIAVEEDGTLNLQKLYTTVPEGRETGKTAAGRKRKTVRIGTATLQDGTVAFADRHVTGEYNTTLFHLGGRISGLSSEENRFADVDLRGNLENQSPLRITGQVNPLRDDLFADLKVSFTDIELSPMTPYSGTYLGYAVDKGQLFLESRYRIDNRKVDSVNKVFIDQLTFGRRIESDKATNLPVRLAVALLKNRKGEIRLDLPVTGRTDDPQFSVWRVMREILKNLFVKANASPLTLLQSMFGWEEDIASVGFDYGSAELSPGEREKLLKLAMALNDRPALKIGVLGFVDQDRDPEGYRNEVLLKKMRAEKLLDLGEDKKNQSGAPGTVQIAPEEESRYLRKVYAKGNFPKPRNFLGVAIEISDAEMKKLVLTNTLVGEQELQSLAEERSAAVRAFLVEEGKVDPAQVFHKSGDIHKAPAKEGEKGSRAEFEVAAE